jgi:hypothetical protein
MICATLCFFTGTKGLLRSYQNCGQPQTKWTDLGGRTVPCRDDRDCQIAAAIIATSGSVRGLATGPGCLLLGLGRQGEQRGQAHAVERGHDRIVVEKGPNRFVRRDVEATLKAHELIKAKL